MRKSNDQSLKEVIEQLLQTYRLKEKLNEIELVNSWEKVMGKTVSSKTREVSIKNKKLYIRLDSAVLRHELMLHKQQIIELLNNHFEAEVVKDVILL